MKVAIEWKRGRRGENYTADTMTYESRCRKFRLVRRTGKFDGGQVWYYALACRGGCWRMIETHRKYRTRRAAERAIARKGVARGPTLRIVG